LRDTLLLHIREEEMGTRKLGLYGIIAEGDDKYL